MGVSFMRNKLHLILCSLLSISIASCGDVTKESEISSSSNSTEDISTTLEESTQTQESLVSTDDSTDEESTTADESTLDDSSTEEVLEDVENFDFSAVSFGDVTTETMEPLGEFSPTTFDVSTFTDNVENIADGVELHNIRYLKEGTLSGQSYSFYIEPKMVVVDLNVASIVAGSYNNTVGGDYTKKSTPYQQAFAWERDNPGKKVIAATNADYFAWGDDGQCVNAFVKNGVILKESHVYDLNDVPASKPMLFGVSSKGARIAPISTKENYDDNLRSTLRYLDKLVVIDKDTKEAKSFDYKLDRGVINDGVGVLKTPKSDDYGVRANAKVYKYKVIQQDKSQEGEVRAYVTEMLAVSDVKSFVNVKDNSYGYIVVHPNYKDIDIEVGDYIDISRIVTSVGDEWYGYTQILGARHSLIENGALAPTLGNENTNGVNGPRSRTAVGIRPDGKVVICSVEEVDPNGNRDTRYGINIKYLAELMRYMGCYDACNFDGGGSSQLITRSDNGKGDFTVKTRSSDFCTYNLNDTRSVLNTIMVVSR